MKKVNSRMINEFKQLYKNGESSCSIGKLFNINPSTVLSHLHENNIKIRTRKDALNLAKKMNRIFIKMHKIPRSSFNLTKEKAYVMGVLCGDGWISFKKIKGSYQIGLQVTDEEFANEFAKNLYKIYKIKPSKIFIKSKVPNWSDSFEILLYSKLVCNDLLKYGSTFKTKDWVVPQIIKNASLQIKANFLKGFFDSEGDVSIKDRRIGATSSNLRGLKDVGIILSNFNMRYKISQASKNKFVLRIQDRKSVEIYFKCIGFVVLHKKYELKTLISNYMMQITLPENVEKLENKMFYLRNKKLTYEKISKKLGLSIGTVWNHLNK